MTKGAKTMFEEDKVFEERYFENVRSFILSDSKRLEEFVQSCFELVKKQGAKFNEDNPNGGMYSGMELTELHYEMQNEMLRAEEAKNDIWFYKKLIKEPYFARVDFVPDRTGRAQRVYIGLRTLQNPDTYETLVCDWRAPVASLFYEDFPCGRAHFEAPAGKIEGELTLKRQYKFKNGELLYFVDSDLKIDDDILRDVLSEQSGNGGLKVIVNSIQREQNAAIRYSESKNLLVTGAAGSGKTSVGFHRLAYLLYRNRKELTSAETVMFSNNDIFSSYVSDIIPELGEMPINYSSFYSVFDAELPTYKTGDYYSVADELIEKNALRRKSAELKFNETFYGELKRAVEEFVPVFKDAAFLGKTVITENELAERFLGIKNTAPALRAEKLCEYANARIDDYFINNKKELEDYYDSVTALDEDTQVVLRHRRRVFKQDTARMITAALDVDPVIIYCNVLYPYLEKCGDDGSVAELTRLSLKNGRLLFEDALCAVRIKQFMGSAAVIPGVKHILIDEAQDMCVLQHIIIRDMFPKASYTLLADKNQAILPQINTADTETLSKLYGATVLSLNKSYRSTAQINRYALSLLPENARYEIFERDGDEVELLKGDVTENIKSCLERFLQKGGNVAVITKTASQAKRLFREIKGDFNEAVLCECDSGSVDSGIAVINLALTKGLEFDSVVVANFDGSFFDEDNKSLLYMAVTRALHRLAICSPDNK